MSKRTRNDIAMSYRINSLGYGRARVSKQFFFKTLLQFLDGEIADLPAGWKVDWLWRNSRKSELRSDTIQNTVGNSRDSFMTLMRRRLQRDLDVIKPRIHKRKHTGKKKRRNKTRNKGKSRRVSQVRRKKPRRSRRHKR